MIITTGLIDWEYTVATPPGYDLVHSSKSFAGGPWLFAPSVTDRWGSVYDAMLEGYREHAPNNDVDQARSNRECYELLAIVRTMGHLGSWYPMVGLEDQIEQAAEALRRDVTDRL